MKRSLRGIALVAVLAASLACERGGGITYLSITSVPGDSIGQGRQLRFTPAKGKFKASHPAPHRVAIQFEEGDKTWTLELAVPRNSEFTPGTYEHAERYPTESPTLPALSISGEGRSCKQLTGRFEVLEAVFGPGTTVERLAVDYEQLCEGDEGALLGAVRIHSEAIRPGQTASRAQERPAEGRRAEAPVKRPPGAGRSLGTTYLDFDSPPGEYIGQGRQFSFTPEDGKFRARHPATNRVSVDLRAGDHDWTLEFVVPSNARFRPGVYEKAARYPFQSPTRPGLSVSGEGRGCNQVTGRFIVQEVVFGEDDNVERLSVDYEQSCDEGRSGPLTGSVRINSSIPPGQIPDSTKDAAPPAAETRPRGTTYIDFDSTPGDYIGQGRQFTVTPDDGNFRVSHPSPNHVSISFNGGSGNSWSLDFALPEKDVFVPGSYEKATRYPFQSPTRPGLSVSGSGRGCNTSTGRFVVIEAVFSGTTVERLAVDYEQSCEGSTEAPLVGSVRINSSASPVIRRQYADRGPAAGRAHGTSRESLPANG
jgi:hypothetical protein